MIVEAFGLPGLSVLELSHMLNRLGVTYGVVKSGQLTRVPGRMTRQSLFPVIFQNARMFLQFGRKFGTSRVVALVLDNPYTIHHELQMRMVGAVFTKKAVIYSQFTENDLKNVLIECKSLTKPKSFNRQPYSIVNEVLKDYSASSLSALQTFLYKIKDVDSREYVSKAVKKWMCTDAAFDVLEPKLRKYISVKHIEALRLILGTPNMKVFREAVRKVAASPARLQKIAKAHKVSAFDIKYLLSTTA